MIEIRDLSFTYENSGENVLKDFNLTISEGEFVCIIGHSGCGKSTLIHLLAGLEKPTRGSIRIDGQRMEGPGTDRAVVFQNYTLPVDDCQEKYYICGNENRTFFKRRGRTAG